MLLVDLFWFCFGVDISRLPVWEQAHVYFLKSKNSTYKDSGERLENEIETAVRES